MARSFDFGDRYPSDLDDTEPVALLEGYSEVDYYVRNPRPNALRFSIPPTRFHPDLGQKSVVVPDRECWAGHIVKRLDDTAQVYSVLAQDGRLIIAKSYRDKTFVKFKVGDSVTVIRGTNDSEYFITGAPGSEELQTLAVSKSEPQIIFGEDTVLFDTEDSAYPIATDFTDFTKKIELTEDGFVKVSQEGKVLYELSYNVVLRNEFLLCFTNIQKAVVTESAGIDANGFGEVEIWKNGAATSQFVTAHLNWMHGGKRAEAGTEILIYWFQDEDDGNGQWVIINAACLT